MERTKQLAGAVIGRVDAGSIAEEAGLLPGDRILTVNGQPLRDVLDYQMRMEDEDVDLEIQRGAETGLIQIEKYAGEGLGLEFGDVTFDGVKPVRLALGVCGPSQAAGWGCRLLRAGLC